MLESYTFLRQRSCMVESAVPKDDLRYWYCDANSHLLGVVRLALQTGLLSFPSPKAAAHSGISES